MLKKIFSKKTNLSFWENFFSNNSLLKWTTFLQIFSHRHLSFWENGCKWCRLLKSGVEWVKNTIFKNIAQQTEGGYPPSNKQRGILSPAPPPLCMKPCTPWFYEPKSDRVTCAFLFFCFFSWDKAKFARSANWSLVVQKFHMYCISPKKRRQVSCHAW
jgi:hypothetical protein